MRRIPTTPPRPRDCNTHSPRQRVARSAPPRTATATGSPSTKPPPTASHRSSAPKWCQRDRAEPQPRLVERHAFHVEHLTGPMPESRAVSRRLRPGPATVDGPRWLGRVGPSPLTRGRAQWAGRPRPSSHTRRDSRARDGSFGVTAARHGSAGTHPPACLPRYPPAVTPIVRLRDHRPPSPGPARPPSTRAIPRANGASVAVR